MIWLYSILDGSVSILNKLQLASTSLYITCFLEEKEDILGTFNLKTNKLRTTLERFCITVTAVKLWNQLHSEMKECPNICQLQYK